MDKMNEKLNNLKKIIKENKEKRKEVKKIINIPTNRIKLEKQDFKNLINNEEDKDKKITLKKKYNEKFKRGFEKNSKGNIIDIKNLEKYYCSSENCEHILHNVNFSIPLGKIVIILGISGSGKSTLLNIMSGLSESTNGDVIVNNQNLFYLNESKRTKFRKKNLSFVFQSYNLIPSLNVIENIKVGENLRSKDTEKISIDTILETLDLKRQAKKYPFQLSGGQNQRVSIGRALAKNSKILFADEPTGALDEQRGREALQLLLDINKKFNTTLIIVTHNPEFQQFADIVLQVKNGGISEIKYNENKMENFEQLTNN